MLFCALNSCFDAARSGVHAVTEDGKAVELVYMRKVYIRKAYIRKVYIRKVYIRKACLWDTVMYSTAWIVYREAAQSRDTHTCLMTQCSPVLPMAARGFSLREYICELVRSPYTRTAIHYVWKWRPIPINIIASALIIAQSIITINARLQHRFTSFSDLKGFTCNLCLQMTSLARYAGSVRWEGRKVWGGGGEGERRDGGGRERREGRE